MVSKDTINDSSFSTTKSLFISIVTEMLVSPGSKVKSRLVIPPKSLEPAVPAVVLILNQKTRVIIDKINGKFD